MLFIPRRAEVPDRGSEKARDSSYAQWALVSCSGMCSRIEGILAAVLEGGGGARILVLVQLEVATLFAG